MLGDVSAAGCDISVELGSTGTKEASSFCRKFTVAAGGVDVFFVEERNSFGSTATATSPLCLNMPPIHTPHTKQNIRIKQAPRRQTHSKYCKEKVLDRLPLLWRRIRRGVTSRRD
jgi:hypothetical protein